MASIVNGEIDLLQLPDVKVIQMDDDEGWKQDYVCIPIKKAGLNRFKTKIVLPICIFPLKHPLSWKTHFIKPNWGKEYRERECLTETPILGSAIISFKYYEQIEPPPFIFNGGDDNNE